MKLNHASVSSEELLELANQVRFVCQRLSRRVRFESDDELAPYQFSVLFKLQSEPKTPTQLAAIEKVSTPSMTRTVNALVAAGWAEKKPHPGDGRQIEVSITAAGRDVVERTMNRRDSWMATRLDRLDADQLAQVRAGIAVLAQVVEQ